MIKEQSLTLNDKVLLAALKLSKGDVRNKFVAEELLVEAWKNDKAAFGLRGYEKEYPDSNNLWVLFLYCGSYENISKIYRSV